MYEQMYLCLCMFHGVAWWWVKKAVFVVDMCSKRIAPHSTQSFFIKPSRYFFFFFLLFLITILKSESFAYIEFATPQGILKRKPHLVNCSKSADFDYEVRLLSSLSSFRTISWSSSSWKKTSQLHEGGFFWCCCCSAAKRSVVSCHVRPILPIALPTTNFNKIKIS